MSDLDAWFIQIISDSLLLTVNSTVNNEIIGLVFVHKDNDAQAHIGYLLKQSYWGQGLAKELLSEFIIWSKDNADWIKLIGGVSKDNLASSSLLKKIGFIEVSSDDPLTTYYEYLLTSS